MTLEYFLKEFPSMQHVHVCFLHAGERVNAWGRVRSGPNGSPSFFYVHVRGFPHIQIESILSLNKIGASMPLTTEQLMKPRVIITANYPGNPFKVGEILEQYADATAFTKIGAEGWGSNVKNPERYPKVCRVLEWYEERYEAEMPHFVKVREGFAAFPAGSVPGHETLRPGDVMSSASARRHCVGFMYLTPATQAEWDAFEAANE